MGGALTWPQPDAESGKSPLMQVPYCGTLAGSHPGHTHESFILRDVGLRLLAPTTTPALSLLNPSIAPHLLIGRRVRRRSLLEGILTPCCTLLPFSIATL